MPMDGYSFVKILMTTLTDFRIKGGYIYVLAVINQTKMKEKVYCAHANFDSIILSGVADCEGHAYYFSSLPDEGIAKDGTQIFLLTPLDKKTFTLELENWNYWLYWLTQEEIPHPLHYAKPREENTFESIASNKNLKNPEGWNRAERYYQNQLLIETYLNHNLPKIQATAIFDFERDGTNTEVEWTVISRKTIHADS